MSNSPSFRLRRAEVADARAVAELGERTFVETFAADNRPEDMIAFLPTAYGEARQRVEILDPNWTTIVAEADRDGADSPTARLGPRLIGFVQLREGASSKAAAGARPIEIQRFYVDSAWHGQGVAPALMREAEAVARTRRASTIWLGVWQRNVRAIAFYEKCGFRRVGEQTFLLGSDLQTDWVMEKELPPPTEP